jgi:hypothetical protein
VCLCVNPCHFSAVGRPLRGRPCPATCEHSEPWPWTSGGACRRGRVGQRRKPRPKKILKDFKKRRRYDGENTLSMLPGRVCAVLAEPEQRKISPARQASPVYTWSHEGGGGFIRFTGRFKKTRTAPKAALSETYLPSRTRTPVPNLKARGLFTKTRDVWQPRRSRFRVRSGNSQSGHLYVGLPAEPAAGRHRVAGKYPFRG